MECIIVPVFWIVIRPKLVIPEGDWAGLLAIYYDHVSMLLVLCIDMVFNSIVFAPHHCFLATVIFAAYNCVNIGVTFGTGVPPYAAITWQTTWDWIQLAIGLVLAAVIWWLWALLTNYRYRKYSATQTKSLYQKRKLLQADGEAVPSGEYSDSLS